MRRHKIERAAAIASRVGRLTRNHSARVNKASGTGQLWKAVNNLTGKQRESDDELPNSVEEMNNFYAAASTDTDYLPPVMKTTASPNETICLESHIFTILETSKPTAEGLDRLPAWFIRLLAAVSPDGLRALFNQTLNSTTVPDQWRVARIRPEKPRRRRRCTRPGDF